MTFKVRTSDTWLCRMVVGAVVETNFQLRERLNPRRKHPFIRRWLVIIGRFFFGKLKQLDELYCPGTLSQRIANAVHYVLMKNYSLPCATVEVLRGPSCQFSRRNKDKS